MLNNFKIATRLQIGFAAVLIIALALVVPVVNIKISDVVHEAEQNELRNLYKSAIAEIESEGRLAQAMSYIIASNPEMNQAMADGRRDDLANRTVPLFKKLKEQYAVRQLQFPRLIPRPIYIVPSIYHPGLLLCKLAQHHL